jgi:hypothetical protein
MEMADIISTTSGTTDTKIALWKTLRAHCSMAEIVELLRYELEQNGSMVSERLANILKKSL